MGASSSSLGPSRRQPVSCTLNMAYARLLLALVQQRQPEAFAAIPLAQRAGIDNHDPLARCTLQEWHTLMDVAEEALGMSDLVPVLAEQFKPWHAGLLGFTLMTSQSVGKLAGLLRRFHHLLNDVFAVQLDQTPERFVLRLHETSVHTSPRLARLSLCIWSQRLRSLTGQPDLSLDARFKGPPPRDVMPYRQLFGGTVQFEQDTNAMSGDVRCVAMPIVSRDMGSHDLLQRQALRQLEMLSGTGEPVVDRVKGVLRARLDEGALSLEQVAAELRMPVRTLQRRLEQAGAHFRLMLDEVRRTVAERHLREGRLSLVELAQALGFADHASFNRAFKRWTGTSPGAYRRAQLQKEGAMR